MWIETVGHASIVLSNKENQPLLITDPWLTGSTYWRSWWLQNYPDEKNLDHIKNSKFVFITHEHPDHFHPPSLRKLFKKSKILIPELPNSPIYSFLIENNFNTEVVKKNKWKEIDCENKISIFSIPLWNDDTVFIVDTPDCLIINLNDAKPPQLLVRKIKKLVQTANKNSIMLSSYSPASIVNSFRVNNESLSIKSKKDYVKYINKLCEDIEPNIFMPFASQAIFQRRDSKWANEFKVTFEDLKNEWKLNKTRLAPCYSKIDLKTLTTTFVDSKNYNSRSDIIINNSLQKQYENEKKYSFSDHDMNLLENKMKKINFFISFFFSKGIGFKIEDTIIIYSKKKLKKIEIDTHDYGRLVNEDFLIEVPGLVLSEVLKNDHFSDLGITMFTIIHVRKKLDPRLVYLFFILISLDEYGHTKSIFNAIVWIFHKICNFSLFYLRPLRLN